MPAATAGRTAAFPVPTWRGPPSVGARYRFYFCKKKRRVSEQPLALSEGEERAEESHGLDVSCCRDFAAARLVSVRARISYWGKAAWFLTNIDGTF